MIKIIRGMGPVRPLIAKEWGFPKNETPFGKLFTGYRNGNRSFKRGLFYGY